MGVASGKLEGKAQVRAYFARGLDGIPALHFTLLQVLRGMDSITIYYQREDGSQVAEVTVLDAYERAIRVRAHYSPDASVWHT